MHFPDFLVRLQIFLWSEVLLESGSIHSSRTVQRWLPRAQDFGTEDTILENLTQLEKVPGARSISDCSSTRIREGAEAVVAGCDPKKF
jgi:hypothetical protein